MAGTDFHTNIFGYQSVDPLDYLLRMEQEAEEDAIALLERLRLGLVDERFKNEPICKIPASNK